MPMIATAGWAATSGWHRVTVTRILNRHLHAAAARMRAIASAWERPCKGIVCRGKGREERRRGVARGGCDATSVKVDVEPWRGDGTEWNEWNERNGRNQNEEIRVQRYSANERAERTREQNEN